MSSWQRHGGDRFAIMDGKYPVAQVVIVNGDRQKAEEVAQLIIAAPDLLAALKAMVEACDMFPAASYHTNARLAIARATGEHP